MNEFSRRDHTPAIVASRQAQAGDGSPWDELPPLPAAPGHASLDGQAGHGSAEWAVDGGLGRPAPWPFLVRRLG